MSQTEYCKKYLSLLDAEIDLATDPEEPEHFRGEGFQNKEQEKVTRVIPKRSRKNSVGE